MREDWRFGIAASSLLLLAYAFMRILVHPTALRDPSTHSPRPYSLSRVQLWWWTLVIIGTWFTLWTVTGIFAPFNATALTLLGLSGGVSVAARLIDGRDADAQAVPMHQCQASSEGFFVDILSDASGVSMHRFQTLLFQVAYAFAFVTESLSRWEFPTFDRFTLALLGFSTGTYTAVKATENRPNPATPNPVTPGPPSSDPNDSQSTQLPPSQIPPSQPPPNQSQSSPPQVNEPQSHPSMPLPASTATFPVPPRAPTSRGVVPLSGPTS